MIQGGTMLFIKEKTNHDPWFRAHRNVNRNIMVLGIIVFLLFFFTACENPTGKEEEEKTITLAIVTGLIPASGSTVPDTVPIFSWDPVTAAEAYEFQIAESSIDLESAVILTSTATSYTPTEALEAGKTYQWRIRAMAGQTRSEWSGPQSLSILDPIKRISINAKADLLAIDDMTAYYVMTADLDLTDTAWVPRGTQEVPFRGVFDGKGYSITGLNITGDLLDQGLFAYIAPEGHIKDLNLRNVSIEVAARTGALGGINRGRIENCSVEGTITAKQYLGGLVGINYGYIQSCTSTVELSGSGQNMAGCVGGIAGYNDGGSIQECEVDLTMTGYSRVGGIAGVNRLGSITGCTVEADLNIPTTAIQIHGTELGGIAGYNHGGTITEVRSTVTMVKTHYGDTLGGIVGTNENVGSIQALIQKAQAAVTLYGGDYIGGLVGYNIGGSILESSVTGNLTGQAYAGGALGCSDGGDITNTHFTGNVWAFDADYLGGLAAYTINGTEINGCSASGTISYIPEGGYQIENYAGGLVGECLNTTIRNSHAAVRIGRAASQSSYGQNSIGGLVGHSGEGSLISSCYASGSVRGKYSIGGLVGSNGGTIEFSYATGEVFGQGRIGAFAGSSGGTIRQSYATGEANGGSDIGAFVGSNGGSIEDCYARGDSCPDSINSPPTGRTIFCDEGLGGFAGSAGASSTINRCFSTGTVGFTTKANAYGGFLGLNSGTSPGDCYYLSTASNRSSGGTPKTNSLLQAQATYTGWDFTGEIENGSADIWAIKSGTNDGYPYLTSVPVH